MGHGLSHLTLSCYGRRTLFLFNGAKMFNELPFKHCKCRKHTDFLPPSKVAFDVSLSFYCILGSWIVVILILLMLLSFILVHKWKYF